MCAPSDNPFGTSWFRSRSNVSATITRSRIVRKAGRSQARIGKPLVSGNLGPVSSAATPIVAHNGNNRLADWTTKSGNADMSVHRDTTYITLAARGRVESGDLRKSHILRFHYGLLTRATLHTDDVVGGVLRLQWQLGSFLHSLPRIKHQRATKAPRSQHGRSKIR